MKSEIQTGPEAQVVTELNDTELGAWIVRNKILLTILLVVILGCLGGLGVYNAQTKKRNLAFSSRLYQFDQKFRGLLEVEKDGAKEVEKIDPQALASAYQDLVNEVGAFDALVPLALKYSDFLVTNGNIAEAEGILRPVREASSPFARFFVGLRLASVYEDLGKTEEAIGILEGINSDGLKLLEEKTYLDLGRLYLKKGDRAKAVKSFEYVANHLAQEDFKKLAKLYLEKLK